MNHFQLITDREEIELLSNELKRYIYGMDNPFVFIHKGEVIAKGEIVFYKDDSVEVKMLEVVNKGKGNGRMFVEYLKNMKNIHEIWGESVPNSVCFWFKVGATFDPVAFNNFIKEDEHEEGFLVPFTIQGEFCSTAS
ncbi:hypothetical protein SMD22_01140 (plasmid) [Brevibacillus halotolerans]|nr:hypothetical protein SMD22_01140 [Brevibacillus halotolerans]